VLRLAEVVRVDRPGFHLSPRDHLEWTPGGSTTWAVFDHDTEYFGRPEQAFMVNFRVADLDAMLAQLRSAGVEVIDALEESEYGRFGWAVDPEGTRFEIWEPPPGR
jgi:predicted enzyme related to lactoylglutathione lyase